MKSKSLLSNVNFMNFKDTLRINKAAAATAEAEAINSSNSGSSKEQQATAATEAAAAVATAAAAAAATAATAAVKSTEVVSKDVSRVDEMVPHGRIDHDLDNLDPNLPL